MPTTSKTGDCRRITGVLELQSLGGLGSVEIGPVAQYRVRGHGAW